MNVIIGNETKNAPTIQDEDFGVPTAPGTPTRPENEFSEHPKVALCARCGVTMADTAADDEKEGFVELIIANNLSLLCLIWTGCWEEMGREPRSWKQAGDFIGVWFPALLVAAIFAVAGFVGAAILLGWNFTIRLVTGAITISVAAVRRLRRRMKKATSEAS